MRICVEVPEAYAAEGSPEEFGARLKLYAALLMYQSGEISAGAACELAGIDRFAFLAECGRRGIATTDYSADELRAEVESLTSRRSA